MILHNVGNSERSGKYYFPDNFKSADITHIYAGKDPTFAKSFGHTITAIHAV